MKRLALVLGAAGLVAAGSIPALATQGHQRGGTSSASCNDGTVTASPAILWPPNHKYVPVDVSYTDNGNDGDNINITDITVSYVDMNGKAGVGAGHTDPDFQVHGVPSPVVAAPGTSSATVDIRSERSGTTGNGSGRVYTLMVTCHDQGGADPNEPGELTGESETVPVFVCVPHDMSAASRAFCESQINP